MTIYILKIKVGAFINQLYKNDLNINRDTLLIS